jgi:hypothetical protein
VGWFNTKLSYATPYLIGFGMIIEEGSRSKGIGSSLVSYLRDNWKKYQRQPDTIGILGTTALKNRWGNKVFRKAGFEPISTITDLEGDEYINYVAGDVKEIRTRMLADEKCKVPHHRLGDPDLDALSLMAAENFPCDFRSMVEIDPDEDKKRLEK